MVRGYRLASLDLASPFDDRPEVLPVPGKISEGLSPTLSLLEGGYRQPTSVCRFGDDTGLVGVQLADPLPPVLRVEMMLRNDKIADERWHSRAVRIAEARAKPGEEVDPATLDVNRRHRFIDVTVHGVLRGQALMIRESNREGWVRQRVRLDVPTAEIDVSRLLLIGFGPAAARLPGATAGLAEPLAGIGLRRIVIGEPAEPLTGWLSTGTNAVDGWRPYDAATGFAVVNPVSARTAVRVEVARPPAPGLAGRVGRKLGRTSPLEGLSIDAVDAAGRPVPVETSGDGTRFTVPAGSGPVQVRFPEALAAAGLRLRTAEDG